MTHGAMVPTALKLCISHLSPGPSGGQEEPFPGHWDGAQVELRMGWARDSDTSQAKRERQVGIGRDPQMVESM